MSAQQATGRSDTREGEVFAAQHIVSSISSECMSHSEAIDTVPLIEHTCQLSGTPVVDSSIRPTSMARRALCPEKPIETTYIQNPRVSIPGRGVIHTVDVRREVYRVHSGSGDSSSTDQGREGSFDIVENGNGRSGAAVFEATIGFEPMHNAFAERPLSHLGTSPMG